MSTALFDLDDQILQIGWTDARNTGGLREVQRPQYGKLLSGFEGE